VTYTLEKRIRQRGIRASVIRAPNGADTELFFPRAEAERVKIRAQFGFPSDKIVIAYSGSGGNPYYRIDLVVASINALQDTEKDGVFFVLYLYDQIEAFERLKSRLKMPDGLIQIRRPVPRSQLAKALSACDIGIVPFDDKPYLKYATSTKLFEYISAGLYVIGTGPEHGELELILSSCPACGLFARPQINEVVLSTTEIIQKGPGLFDDNSRNLRHSFIRENYDLEKTMKRVMGKLYANVFG
jgi:glycosyltransferase involved in cell wall biosynthesis